mmetsp:Transcript_17314/g.38112  ORF Transcript_17314/g.38112 Transcript_17314/m.38112 type:complete len:268 (-) Transcript_17314:470-1273(-)
MLVHDCLLRQAHAVHGSISDLQHGAVLWVKASRFVRRQTEKLVVEEINAIASAHVLAIGLVTHPPLRIWVIPIIDIPPHEGDSFCIIATGATSLEKILSIVGGGQVAAHPTDTCHLALAEHVVHCLLPTARNCPIPHGIIQVLFALEFLESVLEPVLHLLRGRRHWVTRGGIFPLEVLRHEEAADAVGVGGSREFVRHRVCTEEDDHALLRLDLKGLGFLNVEGLYLEGACLGAKENQHHDSVAHELVLPLRDFVLRDGGGLFLRLS